MSNKLLTEATAPGHIGPIPHSLLERVQEHYDPVKYAEHPIDEGFLIYFANELYIFVNVTFKATFKTEDGTEWYSIKFTYASGTTYRMLFPKEIDENQEEGTLAGQHVALYVYNDVMPSETEIDNVVRSITTFFEIDISHYFPQKLL